MIVLHKDPKGETVFTSTNAKGAWTTGNVQTDGAKQTEKEQAEVSTLRKRVTELEQALAELKAEGGCGQLID